MSAVPPNAPSSGLFGPPPKGYIPGLGRGAAGFTTRSDIGNMAAPAGAGGDDDDDETTPAAGAGAGTLATGSRAAELRAAKLQAQKAAASKGQFQDAVSSMDPLATHTEPPLTAQELQQQQDEEDDDDADKIWQAVEDRMNAKRKKKKRKLGETSSVEVDEEGNTTTSSQDASRAKIGAQFRELKQQLATVSEEDWMKIPDVAGDAKLKFKKAQRQRGQDVFTPLTDSLIEQRSHINQEANNKNQHQQQPSFASSSTTGDAAPSTILNMSGLGQARGTVLGMSLDKMSGNVGGQTVVDPQGYLTSMATTTIGGATTTFADGSTTMIGGAIGAAQAMGDIQKARLLLKSIRDTNPKHGPGWIASARVEEAAGKFLKARKLIQEGCQVCPDSEDVWLEAARLHPPNVAKTILATAVRHIPKSVKLFLKAADLESHGHSKKAVLRKALEANPTSMTLWKAAIDLEDSNEDAKLLLSVAVENVPHALDLWLALARLETYDNARKVLNKARKALPNERTIWIAAAKLEEGQQHVDLVQKIMDRAFAALHQKSNSSNNNNNNNNNDDNNNSAVVVTRAQWLTEAEQAEAAGAPLTSAAIVSHAIGMGVDDEDRQRTWADDAKGALARGSIATARAILTHALQAFPTKRALWVQAVDLERRHGTPEALDDVLKAASERLPRVELFWLLRASEQWQAGHVDTAREILTQAFAANPDSESVWLAAAKLEWETGETERARVLLQRARERAPTERVYMKSALLEREHRRYKDALELIEQGMEKYPKFAKFYMMAGQIYAQEMEPKTKSHLEKARKIYQRGLTECPNNIVLWTLTSQLEEQAHVFTAGSSSSSSSSTPTSTVGVGVTKARSLLELARLKNPKTPELWLQAIRLERRHGNTKLAESLMARALQECPSSGLLLSENIMTAPRVEQKSKSTVAIKRCPESPLVIVAVASLFASERKVDKARKWFERSVLLDADLGDSWARYYAFELEHGTQTQQTAVKDRCVKAEPKHGELWQSVTKDMVHRHKTVAEGLELVAQKVIASRTTKNK